MFFSAKSEPTMTVASLRLLVAGSDTATMRQISDLLARHGVDCPSGCLIPLELAADRASRLSPDLLILIMPADATLALEAVRSVHSAARTHILVIGPAHDPKFILGTLHAGADEYLDASQVEVELPQALLRLRNRRTQPVAAEESARVIATLAPSGGSGASTVAANIAIGLAKAHSSCGLIDLRLGAGDLAGVLNLRPLHSVAHFCENLTRIDRIMFDQLFARHESGVELCAAPLEADQARLVTAKGVRQLLAMCRAKFPYVVIDVDNREAEEQAEALWQADILLVVIRLDYTAVRNARRLIARLNSMGISDERVRLVANRHRQPKELPIVQVEQALERKISHFIPDDPARVNAALNKGVALLDYAPRSSIGRSLSQLAFSVNGRHSQS